MVAARSPRKSPVDLTDRQTLLDWNPAPAEIIEQAQAIKEAVLLDFGPGNSVIASWVYSKCFHHLPTTAIDTMAVVLLGDNSAMLLYNPYFTVALGQMNAAFVLYHEARHLLQAHLFSEPHLRNDPTWITATEACINHVTQTRLNRTMPEVLVPDFDKDGQPVLDPKTGVQKQVKQETGVDPKKTYAGYKANLEKNGLTPVDYAAFYRTDFGCYSELNRMVPDPEDKKGKGKPGKGEPGAGAGSCVHQSGDGEEGGGVPEDQETADALGKQILHNVMQAALAGKEQARTELLELIDRTDGSTENITKLWGLLGAARLRGETPKAGKVDWWKQWTNDTLASKLKDGERLQYNKKRGGIDLLMHRDPLLSRRGEDEEKVVLIAIDTSGSMPEHVISYLTKLVGSTDGLEIHWVSFDGVVMPFVAGERVYGGGGTNFQNVVDYAEGRMEVDGNRMDIHPDAVIMLTDGYAPAVRPAEPDKWMWLITENGTDDWIKAQPASEQMDSHQLRTGDGIH
jgi:predicted metal-dependent peptidase